MKAANREAIARALARPDAGGARLFLLHGPDESGSRALLGKLAGTLGPDADRVQLTPAQLVEDPALLSDEAAAFSMFGGPRWISVEGAGRPDDLLPAVSALLEAPRAGGATVVLLFGNVLPGASKLLALALSHPAVQCFASYPPEARDAGQLVVELGREAGLRIAPDLAAQIADDCGNDRGVIAREMEKLALFLDAGPDGPRELTRDAYDQLSAGAEKGNLSRLIDAVLGGDGAGLEVELARLSAERVEGVVLVRALLRRLHLLAKLGAEVADGNSVSAVMATQGRAIFWRDKAAVAAQLGRWRPERVSRAIDRAAALERGLKASGGPGTVAVDEELFALARAAGRGR